MEILHKKGAIALYGQLPPLVVSTTMYRLNFVKVLSCLKFLARACYRSYNFLFHFNEKFILPGRRKKEFPIKINARKDLYENEKNTLDLA